MSKLVDIEPFVKWLKKRREDHIKHSREFKSMDADYDTFLLTRIAVEDGIILSQMNELPTINPEHKMGKWITYVISIFDGEGCKCSECGFEGVPYWDYCPNCGAWMRGKYDEVN